MNCLVFVTVPGPCAVSGRFGGLANLVKSKLAGGEYATESQVTRTSSAPSHGALGTSFVTSSAARQSMRPYLLPVTHPVENDSCKMRASCLDGAPIMPA